MESKRLGGLPFDGQILTLDAASPQEIEVPAGNSLYYLRQASADPEYRYVFHLRHPGCQLRIRGLVEATGQDAPRLETQVIHHLPDTRAETLVRTISRDAAQPRYQGLIRILPQAHGCESYLNHHSLLLGTTARSWTLPSLEILADQVRCSHAATLRCLEPGDLFYLRSRGLDQEEARQALIAAFLADVLPPSPA